MKKLIPDQIRQILACSDSHLSYQRLEQQIGISRASIGRILVAAALTGKSALELLQLSDNELLEAIYPQTRSKYAEPDWQWIHSQLHRKESHFSCFMISSSSTRATTSTPTL